MCDMSCQFDPCPLMTTELTLTQVAKRVNRITSAKLSPGAWGFGKEPYSRVLLAPQVCARPALSFSLSFLVLP